MRGIRIIAGGRLALPLLAALALLGGCSDQRRETGTQVQETEEMKAQTDEMREMYEGMGPRVE